VKRLALHVWAGSLHVSTLLTIIFFFTFPQYLDWKAVRGSGRAPLGLLPVVFAALVGPAFVLLSERQIRFVPRALVPAVRTSAIELLLWLAFVTWHPTGRVVWNLGAVSAGPLNLLYWIAAALAGYSLTLAPGGFGYFTGAGPLLEYASRRNPAPPQFVPRSLYRFSRHPFETWTVAALWITPLATVDRLLWAALMTAHLVVAAEVLERRRARCFGERYRQYQAQVPKWVPFARKPLPRQSGTPGRS